MSDSTPLMKDGLGRPAVKCIARNVKAAWPAFDDDAFVKTSMKGLSKMELRRRVDHIIAALREHLPPAYPKAVRVLTAAGAAWDADGLVPPTSFAVWPVIDFVGTHGLEHYDLSMNALRRLTGLFTAEFAIRPFIERDKNRALGFFERWVADPDESVRRLVSEGSRPRLPWGTRLRVFDEDPEPILRLLDRLKDDESLTVRRSVANHLNDLTKTDPDLVLDRCEAWMRSPTPELEYVVRHATRTLVKAGNPRALRFLGFDPDAKIEVSGLVVSPKRVSVGADAGIRFSVRSRDKKPQRLVIDYAVHHVKADERRAPKVFKLKTMTLGAGAEVSIEKAHKFRIITTRKYYAGRHAAEIIINGKSRGIAEFELRV